MKSECLEYKKEVGLQKCRIRKIRENIDSLTNDVVSHLNKINRILTEVEKTLSNHPEIEENCNLKPNSNSPSY